jgi:hypothetical protein
MKFIEERHARCPSIIARPLPAVYGFDLKDKKSLPMLFWLVWFTPRIA